MFCDLSREHSYNGRNVIGYLNELRHSASTSGFHNKRKEISPRTNGEDRGLKPEDRHSEDYIGFFRGNSEFQNICFNLKLKYLQ